jgi:hypothetical protein
MKPHEVKRPKELERENASWKAIVADKALEVLALKEIPRGMVGRAVGVRRSRCFASVPASASAGHAG